MAGIPLRRRKRGTGGIQLAKTGWDAVWTERGKRRSRRFRTYEEADRYLRSATAGWRDIWLNELRDLLWAELQARLRFKGAEIVSTRMSVVDSGRLGGLRGGPARARALSPQRRTDIARQAAQRRWNA